MRILFHSNAPWAASGYGTQTATFCPRIRDLGHHVAISAFWGLMGSTLEWDGMAVYPGDESYGNRLLPTWAEHEQADLAITLMDVWVLEPDKLRDKLKTPLACWVPVDHEPAPPKVIEFFGRSGARPIAMSRFGERMLRDAGLAPLYVPHGIDTAAFRPIPETRDLMRASLDITPGQFVIGMVANNQGRGPARKSFPEVMQAFKRLLADVPDAILYMHTDMTGRRQGTPIGRLMEQTGVPAENVRYTRQPLLELATVGPDELAAMYSMFDVLANPSYGEGFGIPIVESQACGTPVIVTDGTAMRELCGAGWLVEAEPYYDAQESFYCKPSVPSIYRAMLKAYRSRGDERLRAKAREFALGYDADLVTETYWRPALEALAAERSALKAAA